MEISQAIILTQYPYKESSIIIHAYTRDWGVQSFIINGVRKIRSKRKASAFQPLSVLDITAYYRHNKTIHRIKEWAILEANHGIIGNYGKQGIALFVADLLHKLLRSQESEPILFDFIRQQIRQLSETQDSLAGFPIQFMQQLSLPLGIMPQHNGHQDMTYFDMINGIYTRTEPLHSAFLHKSQALLFGRSFGYNLNKLPHADRQELLGLWLKYYRLHFDSMQTLRSEAVLRELFGT